MEFAVLVVLALVMTAASYAAGVLPWRFGVELHEMTSVSALSMGVLVGTVLCLVIPEGCETIFEDASVAGIPKTAVVGVSLLAGFLLMFVAENFTKGKPSEGKLPLVGQSTLTVGLLLHSAVDGIALGSSFFHKSEGFHIFVFFMIVVHKLPTALSLAVVLRHDGLDAATTEFHLLLFALAAPVASILAYVIILISGLNSPLVLGILFLFSAGSFLYAVLHVMMDFLHHPRFENGLPRADLAICLGGMVVPVLFALAGGD